MDFTCSLKSLIHGHIVNRGHLPVQRDMSGSRISGGRGAYLQGGANSKHCLNFLKNPTKLKNCWVLDPPLSGVLV